MDWLSQNWIWVLLTVGVASFLFRGRGHGGLGGLLGGLGHGGHGGGSGHGGSRGHGGGQVDNRQSSKGPEAAVDPVGGEAVRTAQALTSVYEGKIYYFASKENRDRFEAAPQDYAHKAAGHPVRAAEAANERPRRRRGC